MKSDFVKTYYYGLEIELLFRQFLKLSGFQFCQRLNFDRPFCFVSSFVSRFSWQRHLCLTENRRSQCKLILRFRLPIFSSNNHSWFFLRHLVWYLHSAKIFEIIVCKIEWFPFDLLSDTRSFCSDTILILHQMFLEAVKQRLKYWPDMHLGECRFLIRMLRGNTPNQRFEQHGHARDVNPCD